LPENRAKRIVQLLEPKNDWSKEEVGEMINDVTSAVNPSILKTFGKLIEAKGLTEKQVKVLDRLNAWKGDYPVESIEATVFHRWIYFYLKNTFADELGPEMFNQFVSTHLHKRIIAPLASNPNSVWWDNIKTEAIVENQASIVQASFLDALADLETKLGNDMETWTWGRVHTIEHGHPIGQVDALRSFFNVGPYPINGTREVINNMAFGYSESGEYKVTGGPSTRRVIDFSDIENSMSIIPTGQSGNPFSKHYQDQAEMFLNGEFRKMMMNREEITAKADSKLIFTTK
jgi:penicillin amidase